EISSTTKGESLAGEGRTSPDACLSHGAVNWESPSSASTHYTRLRTASPSIRSSWMDSCNTTLAVLCASVVVRDDWRGSSVFKIIMDVDKRQPQRQLRWAWTASFLFLVSALSAVIHFLQVGTLEDRPSGLHSMLFTPGGIPEERVLFLIANHVMPPAHGRLRDMVSRYEESFAHYPNIDFKYVWTNNFQGTDPEESINDSIMNDLYRRRGSVSQEYLPILRGERPMELVQLRFAGSGIVAYILRFENGDGGTALSWYVCTDPTELAQAQKRSSALGCIYADQHVLREIRPGHGGQSPRGGLRRTVRPTGLSTVSSVLQGRDPQTRECWLQQQWRECFQRGEE
ncbi:hypothetical protein THAOC_07841, partial [Thalassiosira oceanica]